MPPQFPSYHRGMTKNPLKPVKRYRPGKALAEEHSLKEDDEEEEIAQEEERRRQEEAKCRQQTRPAPKATSFPSSTAGKVTKEVKDVTLEDEDEEGFITEEEEEVAKPSTIQKPAVARQAPSAAVELEEEEEEEIESEEEESEEEESSEEEAPKRVLLRPTFIKKDKRKGNEENGDQASSAPGVADTAAEAEARRAQRQEKADFLVRDQLEKEAMARLAGKKAWDEDENIAAEEEALDDRDGLDPEAEYAAWKLRELKRIKRQREAIEAAEKEREEIERRRALNPEEREREDREFIQKQKEEKEAGRGQTGFMQRYFHKGAFFRDDLEREGLDKRNIMGARFIDETNREVLPEYMQIRDMTKLGRKGRTRYKDLRSEDTGRWGEGFDNRPRRPRDDDKFLQNVTDERFLPDRDRPPSEKTVAVVDRIQEGDLASLAPAHILPGQEIINDMMMNVLGTGVGIEVGIGMIINMIEIGENSEKEVIHLMMIETNVVGPRVECRLDTHPYVHYLWPLALKSTYLMHDH
ncbi:microfibrillar-associated protein MfaP1, putative [Talaromyces stipitatus ATCC 10500]|uniref:Microfibrillar-associated protein MfaP1, putative n=1 Tax=Talaromyces stipitatus (strain ATCC 10500 / CBS 375.48 / QM 6759 / NRRL 1006) TaxID=441959 RepID=B8LST9_TALSN|nr:microfibrillar-associated protein MfaP1, putative [Talaromyces stipitatus ATCC 10500]EED22935.1 microfibrillar-associated protein MfaP1, putative [Talaromyces stipitatus ATCC 10500]